MRIGIIGSGMIAGTLAELLSANGEDVRLTNRRGPNSLRAIATTHPGVSPSTLDDAVAEADMAILAIPFGQYTHIPADLFAGTTLVDATNYYPERDGHIATLDTGTTASSELIGTHFADARVVKAFNTIHYDHLRAHGAPGAPAETRRALPISGDDANAKQTVATVIDQLGFAPLDIGSLAHSGRQQPGTPIYNVRLTAAETRQLTRRTR